MKTSRKNAALAIMADYNNYEVRPVSFKTIYNRVFWRNGAWHLIGYAHDYTAVWILHRLRYPTTPGNTSNNHPQKSITMKANKRTSYDPFSANADDRRASALYLANIYIGEL